MLEALNWYAIILLLGLLTLPVSFLAFKHLPDRGYSFSKPLGLLIISLLAWWLANLKWLDFTGLTAWLCVGLWGIFCSLLLMAAPGLRTAFKEWFSRPANLKLALTSELLFLAGYASVLTLRSFIVDSNSWTERFFNFAFLNSIITTTTLPPPDPWFAGQPLNYYYGSHLLLGMMGKLTGLGADFAYTLGMGLVFALSAQACFGLVTNLVSLCRGKSGPVIKTGLLGVVFLLVAGNLSIIRSVLKHGFLPWGDQLWPHKLDVFGLTGMIYDTNSEGNSVLILTEFPVNSYIKGDLQANQMDVIFILLVLGLSLQFLVRPRKWVLLNNPLSWRALPVLLLAGTLVGAMNFINGVDFIPFLAFTLVLMGLGELRGPGKLPGKIARWVVQSAALLIATKQVYAFYSTNYANMVKAKPVENLADVPVVGWLSQYVALSLNNHTNLSEYLVHFGLFLLPVFTFYGLAVSRLWQEERVQTVKPLPGMIRLWVKIVGLEFACIGGFGLAVALNELKEGEFTLRSAVFPLLGLAGALVTLWPGVWEEVRRRPRLALEGMAGLSLLTVGILIRFELLGVLGGLAYFTARLAWRYLKEFETDNAWRFVSGLFVVLTVGLAALLTLSSELIYVRDIQDTRFNMVLKFWQESWLLYSISAAFATWQVINWTKDTQPVQESAGTSGQKKAAARDKLPAGAGGRGWPWVTGSGFNLIRLGTLRRQFVEEPDMPGNWAAYSPSEKKPLQNQPLGSGRRIEMVLEASDSREATGSGLLILRRTWLAGLVVLVIIALAVPVLYSRQITNNFSTNYGLNSEAWYARTLPAEYPAMRFLKEYVQKDPARRGIVLENSAMLYSYGSRISTYTGLSTLVGWPFHELQWRGYLDEQEVWKPWNATNRIYQTTDPVEAEALLKQYNVKYVFVGQIENGTSPLYSNIAEFARYSPESLAKFSKFMKQIYADPKNNIYVYAFD